MEINLVSRDRLADHFPIVWFSATEGDEKMARLDHWPETELVNNETMKLEAFETVWRDFYSGQRLRNWTKPYHYTFKDTMYGDTYNCMVAFTARWRTGPWFETSCYQSSPLGCPCSYLSRPAMVVAIWVQKLHGWYASFGVRHQFTMVGIINCCVTSLVIYCCCRF